MVTELPVEDVRRQELLERKQDLLERIEQQ